MRCVSSCTPLRPVALSTFTSLGCSRFASSAASRAHVLALDPSMAIEPRGITPQDTAIFVLGMIPFVWASNEFWRRIAVDEPFGTTRDSVRIRDTDDMDDLGRPDGSRRVLGKGAIRVANLLFAAVAATLALVAYVGYQAITSAPAGQ
mmetsp:Transcript_18945/g.48834  ORF Transcript_18945/g.48834 Transcript_18945/m.48834 type:complete len:148 (-) Transcript_18945:139-582(-)